MILLENKHEGAYTDFKKTYDSIEEYFANYDNPNDVRKIRNLADIFLTFGLTINNMCSLLN